MKMFLFVSAAISAYLAAGLNPAIIFSRAIYKKDIRECGSGNPGFTNFKRCFGNKYAYWVLCLDLLKSAVVVAIFAGLFWKYMGIYHLGAAYTGLFAMLGHAFPVWYGFKGGKGFLVSLSTVFVIDIRAGLLTTAVMIILLLTTKYMSVATVIAMLLSPVFLAMLDIPLNAAGIVAAIAIFMAIRHKENFRRLTDGTESRFLLKLK